MSAVAALPSPPHPGRPRGRHRRAVPPAVRVTQAAALVGRLGSLVTLAALMVLAATAGGLTDGVPLTEDATVSVTFDGR